MGRIPAHRAGSLPGVLQTGKVVLGTRLQTVDLHSSIRRFDRGPNYFAWNHSDVVQRRSRGKAQGWQAHTLPTGMGKGQWRPACSQGSSFPIGFRPAHGTGESRGYKGTAALLGCAADSRMVHGYTSQSVTQSRKASMNRHIISSLGNSFVNGCVSLNAVRKG